MTTIEDPGQEKAVNAPRTLCRAPLYRGRKGAPYALPADFCASAAFSLSRKFLKLTLAFCGSVAKHLHLQELEKLFGFVGAESLYKGDSVYYMLLKAQLVRSTNRRSVYRLVRQGNY